MKKTTDKERVILDLCGGTGSWSRPYAEAGYTVPEYPRKGPGSWANQSKRLRSITPAGFAKAFFRANS